MTLTQVWGALVIFLVCPLLGGLPLIHWIAYAITGRRLSQTGTGNVSVSAAFYHGGTVTGILAVFSEAFKGIAAVLLARAFFPTEPVWELVALIALVVGRYWIAKGAGTTNVVWGIAVHDPIAAGLIFLIGGISFTLVRQRTAGRLGILVLLVLILSLRHPEDLERIVAAIALAVLLAWIYYKVPDDLDLPTHAGTESKAVFRFFQGNQAILSLADKLDARKVGQKAANLAQLKHWGYPVPDGWVLRAGDDPQPLVDWLQPTNDRPLVVRSSAIGEDSESASAAGQYASVLNVTNREALQSAIIECLSSYTSSSALQYRQDRQLEEGAMAVIVQKQVSGPFSGVAFSRDPIDQLSSAVVIEALPGGAAQVVSGQVTPNHYRVYLPELNHSGDTASQLEPESIRIEGDGKLSQDLIRSVATIARELESLYRGIPQDIEWTYDGQQVWLLQARPITTLLPIWTRKIAAEVIPGLICPLTWSINRPLTCGIWGELFALVLGSRASGLDFKQTATLHFSRAYFNATLLGEIFLRMGLPPESLEFLTRGAKMSKPPLRSTLRNLPGLLRLLGREQQLVKDFYTDKKRYFTPTLEQLQSQSPEQLSLEALLERIETILATLRKATYYSILAPLSLSLRQAFLKVPETELDNTQTPEVKSIRALTQLAVNTRNLMPIDELNLDRRASVFSALAEMPDGENVIQQFNQWLAHYGYLSEVATDIAVPRWQEDPRPVRELFVQFLLHEPEEKPQSLRKTQGFKNTLVQRRLDLKGQATEVYSRLLAHLRWSFMALGKSWQASGELVQAEDIFFLEYSECHLLAAEGGHSQAPAFKAGERVTSAQPKVRFTELVKRRRAQFEQHRQLSSVPYVTYGNPAPMSVWRSESFPTSERQLQGIAASPGQAEGQVKIIHTLQGLAQVDRQTILVVPYTDSGWAPLLTRAGGIIAEVGGRLSHGAIVAREYGIPAVMDIHGATQRLRDGQRVRIDGQTGRVEILD